MNIEDDIYQISIGNCSVEETIDQLLSEVSLDTVVKLGAGAKELRKPLFRKESLNNDYVDEDVQGAAMAVRAIRKTKEVSKVMARAARKLPSMKRVKALQHAQNLGKLKLHKSAIDTASRLARGY